MPGVRGAAPHRTLRAVERERVEARVVEPEARLDARPQDGGLYAEPVRVGVLAELRGDLGHGEAPGEQIALQLHRRERERRDAPVLVDDGVAGVLP
jgi:hypothetical protein